MQEIVFFVGAYANCEINAIKSIVLILASSLDSMRDSLVLHSADVRRKSFPNCFPKCSNHQYTSMFFCFEIELLFYYTDRTVYQSYQIVSSISLHVRSFLLLKNESEIFRWICTYQKVSTGFFRRSLTIVIFQINQC